LVHSHVALGTRLHKKAAVGLCKLQAHFSTHLALLSLQQAKRG
jgi:hypothetical protein